MRLVWLTTSVSLPLTHLLWVKAEDLTSGEVMDLASYDDSRRKACQLALNTFLDQEMDSRLVLDYAESSEFAILEQERDGNQVRETLRRWYPNSPLNLRYKQACETSAQAAKFAIFTGVMECHKKRRDDDRDTFTTTTWVYENQGNCFPTTGDACQHYVEHPGDWEIDFKAATSTSCRVLPETVAEYYANLTADTASLRPPGEPHFVDDGAAPPHYNRLAQSRCKGAIGDIVLDDRYEALADEIFHQVGLVRERAIQIHPYFIQYQEGPSDPAVAEEYYQTCRAQLGDEGASFVRLVYATMDCVNTGKIAYGVHGERTTYVMANITRCFPLPGCEHYRQSLGQWMVDEIQADGGLACSLRAEGYEEIVVLGYGDNDNSSSTAPSKDDRTNTTRSSRSWIRVMVSVALVSLFVGGTYFVRGQQQGKVGHLPLPTKELELAVMDVSCAGEDRQFDETQHFTIA